MKPLTTLLFLLSITLVQWSYGQRGVRLGYIDMDYILENVTEYKKASDLLDKSVEEWKKDIELKKIGLEQQREQFLAEKILLTPELIKDREAELKIMAEDIVRLQNSYFGPQGRYLVQKTKLLQPVQDQVLSIVREIAQQRKYDFIFDRSSDLVMLYSAKNYDISDLVLKKINALQRTEERKKKIEERKTKLENITKN